jgi:MFS family permease
LTASTDASPTPAESEFRGGWRIVLGSTIGLGTGGALLSFVASLLIIPLTKEFGWSRGDMSIAGATAFVGVTCAIPVIGWLIDRVGHRRVALICGTALGLLYVAGANQPGSFAVYLLFMVLVGTMGAGTGALVYTRPIIGWFDRQRGLALGLATAGTSISIFVAPPIMQEVITAYGWRGGFYALAVLTTLVGLPLALFLIGKPKLKHAVTSAAVAAADAPAMPDLREAARTPRFWLLVAALVCINIPGSGVVGQLAPLISDTGLSARAVAIVMSLYAVGLLSGRIGCGYCLDRLQAPLVAAVFTFVPTFGCLLLLLPEPSFVVAALAVVLIGVQQGSETDLLAYFISRGFGIRRYGSIYGAVATFGAASTLVGLLLFGQMHDATGSYDIALIIGAAAFVLGSAAFFAISRTKAVWIQPALP